MNKQNNTYTIIYIIVMVVVVGAALAATSMALKPRQEKNARADRMGQILKAAHIVPQAGQSVTDLFAERITEQFTVNSKGEKTGTDALNVDMKNEVKLPADERRLPVFVCTLPDGAVKYILPAYGAGLWGPIWGYLAIDADGSTVYGAYFSHEGETPGLGANIAEPVFCDQFNSDLHLFKDGKFYPIEVVKKGQKPLNDADYVDGVSGGTITSKGVGAMLDNCLAPYAEFLKTLNK